jgi:hypothetical protein
MKQCEIKHHYGFILNVTATRWGLLRLVVLLSLLLAGMPAQAGVAYQFAPTGQLPNGCEINPSSTTSYTCGAVTLAAGDTITVGLFTPVTVTFTGTFTTAAGNMVNTGGITSDLNLVMGSEVTLGADSIVNANVTGTAAINLGANSSIGGNITASTTTGVVSLGENTTVGGFIHTDAGAVSVAGSSVVGGDIATDAGFVSLLTNISVGGGIKTIAGGINVGAESSICGSVISTGVGIVTITTNVQIGGDISTVLGAITVNSGSTVVGNIIITGAGIVTSTNNLIGGNIFTVAGAITLTNSRVGGDVLSSGGGVVTTTTSFINDNTLFVPAPPSCLVTPLFDHIQIEHDDGKGLTCAAEIVTLKACADSTCSSLYYDAIDVALSINGIVSQMINIVGGTFDANVAYTTEGTAMLSVGQAYQCEIGGSTICDLTFTDAGFRFLYGAAETTSISNQISGNDFTDIIKLQAVENVDGVCTGLFTGNIDVELSQQNIVPSGNTGLSFKVNGISGTTIDKHDTFTPIELTFDADSKATIPTPVYLDAGKIRLHAKYTGVDDNVGVSLIGNSSDFWVSPAKLVVTAKTDGNSIDGNLDSSPIKHKAGQPFDFTVTAYNALGTSADNITLNYIPNDIQLSLTRTGPTAGGVDGTFNYGNGTILSSLTPDYQSVTLSAFDSGIYSTVIASYSEVGLLTLDLQDIGYGLPDITITSESLDIGRFTPDYFKQTVVEEGAFYAVCSQNTPFAYTGQVIESDPLNDPAIGAIYYLINPVVELTAKNVQGDTVENYTELGYNKFSAAADFIRRPTTDSTILGKDKNLLPLTANLLAGTLSHDGLVASAPSFGLPLGAGILHYELAEGDNFFYPRNENSEIFAQDNDIDFLIDHVKFVDDDGIGIGIEFYEDIIGTGSINIRFGRALIDNSFGPETANFPQKLSTQYLNASGRYVVNEEDSCTLYDASNIILTSGTLNKYLTGVNTVTGQLAEGKTQAMTLTAPGAGKQGSIEVEYTIYDWLKYDWDWNGVVAKDYVQNPTATATFGLFRGNDRIIYQREVFY